MPFIDNQDQETDLINTHKSINIKSLNTHQSLKTIIDEYEFDDEEVKLLEITQSETETVKSRNEDANDDDDDFEYVLHSNKITQTRSLLLFQFC